MAMRDRIRTLAVPILLGLTLLAVGCGPVASLEPIYTEKDLVFDPAALGVWYHDGAHVHVTRDPKCRGHVFQCQRDEKAYRLVVVGTPHKGERQIAVFEAHLVQLKDHLFLDLFPDFDDGYTRVSGWHGGNVRLAHQIALVKQLTPAPLVTFMDEKYLKKHPPSIRHAPPDDTVLITAPTKEVQRFLRKAVKRGAFEHDESELIWELTASKATALHFAAAQGHAKEIQQLIKKGADVNARDEEDRTPLHWATEFKQIRAFAQLIAAGANVNTADYRGTTPLYLAAERGDANLVKTLLDKGAEVNVKRRFTPLHAAAAAGDTLIAEMLLAKGADPDVGTANGETPLLAAAYSGSVRIVEALLAKGVAVNTRTQHGTTPLHAGATSDSVGIVELLLAKGLDINVSAARGETPLHTAAHAGSIAAAEALLAKGADVNVKDKNGSTPLYYALWNHHTATVEWLLSNGADVNAENNGWTPLHRAVADEDTLITKLLLANGADVNAKTEYGYGTTPLHKAAGTGNTAIVELLLSQDADPNAKDNRGKTPIDVATDSKIIELLQQHTKKK
jgi:ankyrin repeat protein